MAVLGVALAGPAVGGEVSKVVPPHGVTVASPAVQSAATNPFATARVVQANGSTAPATTTTVGVSPELIPLPAEQEEEAGADAEGMSARSLLLIILGVASLLGLGGIWVIQRSRSELD